MRIRHQGDFPVYLIRHGETVYNVEKRLQDGRNDSPLTPRGRDQARAIGVLLRDAMAGAPDFVCSPMPRARATMAIIREAIGLPPDGYAIDPRVTEIDAGAWSGLFAPDIREADRERFEARRHDKWNIPCPGGESFAMVAERARQWFEGLKSETIVVSHGTFGRVLRLIYAGLAPEHYETLDEPQDCIFRLYGGGIERLSAVSALA